MIPCQISGCPNDAGDKGFCEQHRNEKIKQMQAWVTEEQYKPENAPKSLADLEALLPRQKEPRVPVSAIPYQGMKQASGTKKKERKICTLEFCAETIRKKGAIYCSWHRRHHQAGLPLVPIPHPLPTVCEVPACQATPEKVGFCRLHFYQLRKHGKIFEVIECSNDGCSNPSLPEKVLCKQCLNFKVSQIDQRIKEKNL